jgi:hypothetical protein
VPQRGRGGGESVSPEAGELLASLREHPENFLHMVGFKRKCDVYGEWMRMMLYDEGDVTIQGFRGSGKTVCVSGALALLLMLFPYLRVAFIRKTDVDVKEVMAQTAKMIAHPQSAALTKLIWGAPVQLTTVTQGELNTNLNVDPRGASQLVGMGINGSITGKHYDIIFTDDIVNTKDRQSRSEREHTKAVYMELQNVKNRGGRIINTGTPWHVDDCFSIMPPARKWDWTTMPEVISPEEAAHIKERMTPSLWAANYELRHIPSDDVLFTSPKTGADILNILDGEAHVDAAYHGDDFTAFTIIGYHDNVWYVYGKMWRKHVEDVTPLMIADMQKFRIRKIHMENNADKGYAAAPFKKAGLKPIPYHESMQKFVKIVTHLKTAWPDIVFCEGTDQAYIDQICDYTEDAEHDDAPDSLASLLARGKFRSKPYSPRLGNQGGAQRVSLYG